MYKAPEHLAGLRNAVRAYGFAVTDVVRALNRLKAVLLSRGMNADTSVYDVKKHPEWLKQLSSPHRELAEWLGRQLDQVEPLRDEAQRWLLTEARKIAAMVLSMWKHQEVYDPKRHLPSLDQP